MKKNVFLTICCSIFLTTSCVNSIDRKIEVKTEIVETPQQKAEKQDREFEFLQEIGFAKAFTKMKKWQDLHNFYQEVSKKVSVKDHPFFDILRMSCVQEISHAGLCEDKSKDALLWQEYYFHELMKCKYQPTKASYLLLKVLEPRWGKEKVRWHAQNIYQKNEAEYLIALGLTKKDRNKRMSDEKVGSPVAEQMATYIEKLKAL